MQGAGGMILYDAEWLNEFICHLKQQEIICIADEVMTGFGRTGNFFASEYIHHKPDIICLSKGLTGGSLPLAITACRIELFEAFLDDDAKKTFFHGHSYTANPLACAAALASLELLQKEECMQAIDTIGQSNKSFIEELSGYQPVKNPRSRGTILAFEINSGKNEYLNRMKETIINLSLENGVFLRPLGNTVYIMPPYCITREELQQVYVVIKKIASMFE